MKRGLKAFMAMVLVVVLVLALFSGCGGSSKDNAAQTENQQSTSTEATGSAKATSEPIKLTYWSDLGAGKGQGAMKTLAENVVWQKIQELKGIQIEFQHPPIDSADEQFNLIIASRNYPDLIEYNWTNVAGGPVSLLNDNVIIPLNDHIAKNAPNLTKFYAENEEIRKEQELDDGTYYCFPSVYGDLTVRSSGGPIIRMDWLKKLGREIPTTIDEWTEMLRAVKGKDLNGNGEDDEIPFFFARSDIDDIPAISSAYGVTTGFLQDNGKVFYSPIEPAYKDFLTLMNQWYKEGLMDPESLVAKSQLKTEKYTSNRVFAIPGYMGGAITTYTNIMKDKVPDLEMMPVPYPTLKKGDTPLLSTREYSFNGSGVAITTSCKHVAEAVDMLDYGYGEEGHMLMNFGIEGQSYTMVDGKPTYTDLILKNPDGLSNLQAMAKYCYWQSSAPCVKYSDVVNQRDRLPAQIEGRKYWMAAKNDRMLPFVTPSSEESKELASIMTDIQTYTDEMFDQFVSGKTPLSEFDAYVKRIKGMGIDRAIEITQAQVDRYSKRP